MIKLLAVDMDGTCLNDKKYISEQTLSALREAADAGILVIPTTGRALNCLPTQLMKEHFYRYAISSNGALANDVRTGECLFEARIPCQEVLPLLKESSRNHLGISAHINQDFVLQGHFLLAMGKMSYRKDAVNTVYTKSVEELIKREQTDVEEVQLFHFTPAARKRAAEMLAGYPQFDMAFSDFYVEIYSRKASKGSALAALAERLGICKEEVACIGDAENDLSMFASSGMKFAMGNAIHKLKEKADVVLPDNNSDGVACAIREYLLKH